MIKRDLIRLVFWLCLVVFLLVSTAFLTAGSWLNLRNSPRRADYIVLLSGETLRAFFAGDLYKTNYASKILVSRSAESKSEKLMRGLGLNVPSENQVNLMILEKVGVKSEDIEVFGEGSISTAEEASSLNEFFKKRQMDARATTLLIVTSPYHTRRANLIFSGVFPRENICVVRTPYEDFPVDWWSDQSASRNVLWEVSKLIFFIFGGRFHKI